MKLKIILIALVLAATGCDAKKDTVEQGREAVKEVVTQPFNQRDSIKESLKQSEDKQKAAIEEAEKELK